jgi:hypothetical protein
MKKQKKPPPTTKTHCRWHSKNYFAPFKESVDPNREGNLIK